MVNRITLKGKSETAESIVQSDSKASEGIAVFDVVGLFIRRIKFITIFTGTIAVLTAAIVIMMPNEYDSHATILPSGKADKLSELKSLTGFGSVSADENSSELFPSIIRSNLITDALMQAEIDFVHDNKSMSLTLAEYFEEENRDELRKELSESFSVHSDKKTGIINITVRTEYPGFSKAILELCIEELETFNLHKRRSQGKENVSYLTSQLKEKQKELDRAEQRLEEFRMTNRNWAATTNPEILIALGRLERDAGVKTNTFLFLTKEYEAAKFEALKDVPIVRILDKPNLPTVKAAPKRAMSIILVTVMAFFLAILIVGGTEVLSKLKKNEEKESYLAFQNDFSRTFPRISKLIIRSREHETV